jgi:hypothetical protein
MIQDRKKDNTNTRLSENPLGQFEPGGSQGPIEDRTEYERRVREVADPEQREFLDEAGRFATTWEYMSSLQMELPPEVVALVINLKDQGLSVRERITRMRSINQRLMEFINQHDRKSSGVRQ